MRYDPVKVASWAGALVVSAAMWVGILKVVGVL